MTTKPNKYQRSVKGVTLDVYDVLMAWGVTNPGVQHAIKKLLQPGQRGDKGLVQDLTEAGQSVARAIELEGGAIVPEIPSLYIYGRPACGKSTNAGVIMKHFGLTTLVDDYGYSERRPKITGVGELIIGTNLESGPKGVREMPFKKAMNAVKGITERDELLAALESLVLFSKPTKTNAVALQNAHIVIANAKGGES